MFDVKQCVMWTRNRKYLVSVNEDLKRSGILFLNVICVPPIDEKETLLDFIYQVCNQLFMPCLHFESKRSKTIQCNKKCDGKTLHFTVQRKLFTFTHYNFYMCVVASFSNKIILFASQCQTLF